MGYCYMHQVIQIRCLPSSINFFGCQGGSHRSNDRAQDAGHAVQVVNPAGVLDLQFLLQDGLNGEEEEEKEELMEGLCQRCG